MWGSCSESNSDSKYKEENNNWILGGESEKTQVKHTLYSQFDGQKRLQDTLENMSHKQQVTHWSFSYLTGMR